MRNLHNNPGKLVHNHVSMHKDPQARGLNMKAIKSHIKAPSCYRLRLAVHLGQQRVQRL